MEIVRFADEYDAFAALAGSVPADLRQRDAGNGRLEGRWLAYDGDRLVGAATAMRRPDDRVFLSFVAVAHAVGALGAVAASGLGRPVFATVDGEDRKRLGSLQNAGFVIEIENDAFEIRFDAVLRWLRRAWMPPGISLVPADQVDEDRLFDLDNRLRNDVPGTNGWRGDRVWFHDELADAPPFDPTGYLVAVDERSDEYTGLVRFWRNPSSPRLGLIGVVPEHRHKTIAAALLRAGVEASSTWGSAMFTTETSRSNRAIHPRLVRLGATRTGHSIQLVHA